MRGAWEGKTRAPPACHHLLSRRRPGPQCAPCGPPRPHRGTRHGGRAASPPALAPLLSKKTPPPRTTHPRRSQALALAGARSHARRASSAASSQWPSCRWAWDRAAKRAGSAGAAATACGECDGMVGEGEGRLRNGKALGGGTPISVCARARRASPPPRALPLPLSLSPGHTGPPPAHSPRPRTPPRRRRRQRRPWWGARREKKKKKCERAGGRA